jgi:hypothetical protein
MNINTRSHQGLRLKAIPLAVTLVLAVGLPVLAALCALFANRVFGVAGPSDPALPWLYLQHTFQLLLALIGIAVAKRFKAADYGLHCPMFGVGYYLKACMWDQPRKSLFAPCLLPIWRLLCRVACGWVALK